MQQAGFDFGNPCLIDFNVDFGTWPPAKTAIRELEQRYPSTKVYEPTADDDGYVQFQLFEILSYDLVVRTQKEVTTLMSPYGGSCESWGVLH
jgi:hypothetical protein